MSQKAKYFLKIGIFWAVFMAIATTLLEAWQKGSFEVFATWYFAVKLPVYFLLGIGIGYFNWKNREKPSEK